MLLSKTLISAALAASFGLGYIAQASATTLAFEFRSGGAGFGIEVSPRANAGRWDRNGGRGRDQTRLSAGDIRRALVGQGFRQIHNLRLRGAIYQARAIDPRGEPVGLVVNARNGAVLNIYRTR